VPEQLKELLGKSVTFLIGLLIFTFLYITFVRPKHFKSMSELKVRCQQMQEQRCISYSDLEIHYEGKIVATYDSETRQWKTEDSTKATMATINILEQADTFAQVVLDSMK